MSEILKQLLQWPPTATTVIGLGLIAGWAVYHFTGSFEWALFGMGVFKCLCPQDGAVVDETVDLIGKMPK